MMNRIINNVIAFLTIFLCCQTMDAVMNTDNGDDPVKQRLAKMSKPMRKECLNVIKLLKKEGWRVYEEDGRINSDDRTSVEDAFSGYFLRLDQLGVEATPLVAVGNDKSLDVALRMARHRAVAQYVYLKETHVQGYTVTEVTDIAYNNVLEANSKITSVNIANAQRNIKNLQPDLILFKGDKKEGFEVRTYFIMNLTD